MRRGFVCLALCAACAAPPPVPPTAVIDVSPGAICLGDGFATPISLSGMRSAARLSLVPAPPDPEAPPLMFEWLLEGAEYSVVDGDVDEAALTVTSAGDRPLHVTLTVSTVEGGVAETLRTIGVIDPVAPPCDEAGECPDGSECISQGSATFCVPDDACAIDDDCGCGSICDATISRCVPEGA